MCGDATTSVRRKRKVAWRKVARRKQQEEDRFLLLTP